LYKEYAMLSIRLDKDVRSLSEFRARVAAYVGEVCATGRPLLLTQHGRGMALVIDVREFEIMRERLETLERIAAERQPPGGGPSGLLHA
jgi:antitoxin YefM